MSVSFFPYAHPRPFLPHRRTVSVSGSSHMVKSGEVSDIGGISISCNALVGHEPMQERHPTHCEAMTTTGRFLCLRSGGFVASGNRASNGQCGMHKSQPVQSASVMATIDCPMAFPTGLGF